MLIFNAQKIEDVLDYPSLIEHLRLAFQGNVKIPTRHHHTISTSGSEATLLLMPAWQAEQYIGIKIATVFPDNVKYGLPSVMAQYLLLDGQTGEPLAQMEGRHLTLKRTAAASALAASYLARTDSTRMLMVGAGTLAQPLIEAHATVRPIREVVIWNRSQARAEKLAMALKTTRLKVHITTDLKFATQQADIISCATLAHQPLINGEWLSPGTHIDLVGGFTPAMREADDEVIRRSRVYVDTRQGAMQEAGDIVQPLKAGLLTAEEIIGDLFDLTRNQIKGRRTETEITLFKSVGIALEDLAAAQLVYDRFKAQP